LVTVLYNPRSKTRVGQLDEAVGIFRAARPGSTPVGVVTAAGRSAQALVITDLDHLLDQHVDMQSVVVVGGSATRQIGPWLVTARGYADRIA